ncbi:hypothetical protein CPB84DRAFT_1852004 [Gymnopilus junonius]|uniref:Uncharacterized protein n=1 Tax=Gymnopilus junonius TaxID=109634 RepID=A0A9P5THX2_GYMJU|nr:hypothetical protein CPB84DRAFT_1852004 [Gymnopilus junonius]
MATFVDQPPEAAEQERSPRDRDKATEVDLGPLVGRKRGFKTRERIPNSGRIGGMEMWVDEEKGEGGSRRRVGTGTSDSGPQNHNGAKQVDGTGNGGGPMGPPPVPVRRKSRSPPPLPPPSAAATKTG